MRSTTTTTVTIQGMTCGGCAGKVSAAARYVAGVQAAQVDLAAGTLIVTGQDVDEAALRAAVTDAGYRPS